MQGTLLATATPGTVNVNLARVPHLLMSTALQSALHVVSQSCGRSAEVATCLLKLRTHKMAKPKASAALFDQLDKAIKGGEGDDIVGKMKVTTHTLLASTACQ